MILRPPTRFPTDIENTLFVMPYRTTNATLFRFRNCCTMQLIFYKMRELPLSTRQQLSGRRTRDVEDVIGSKSTQKELF